MKQIDALLIGIKSGLITSLCCITPVILAVLFVLSGVGSVALALSIPKYKNYFIAAGIFFMIVSIWARIKHERGVCNINAIKEYKILILTTLLIYAIFFIITIYILLPIIVEKLLKFI